MFRFIALPIGFGLTFAISTFAQLPPGYQGVIQITNDNAFNRRPSMNNHGQFVFAKRIDPFDEYTSEIYLYDNGVLTRLTEDYIWDDFPTINDDGEITWSRAIGPGGTHEIMLYHHTQLIRLTDDDLWDYSPWINNNGLIAWGQYTLEGCLEADGNIFLYDGQSIQQISFDVGYSNQRPHVNDLGDIVWTRYNFCNHPYTSEIMMYSDGVITALTGDQGAPRAPSINNDRLVAWLQDDPPGWDDHICLWQDGVTTVLTDWGSGPCLNNRGDVLFNRWHEDSSTWQVWLYLNETGDFRQLTDDDPFNNSRGDIDDHGNLTWHGGDPTTMDLDIKLLKRFPDGDLNCDGAVNAFDVDPFVLALTDPSVYELSYPACDYLLADFDANGAVNAFDIDPFVEVLTP